MDASVIEFSDFKVSLKQVEEEGQIEDKSISIDEQTTHSSKQSYFQSSSNLDIGEETLIVDQEIFIYSSDFSSNLFLNSTSEEHINTANDSRCSDILIEKIRDINPHIEKEIIDPHQYILPCSEDRLDFYDSTSSIKPINLIDGKPQTNHLIFK